MYQQSRHRNGSEAIMLWRERQIKKRASALVRCLTSATGLSGEPEFGDGTKKLDAHTGLAFDPGADVNHADCVFSLIHFVGKKKALPANHRGLDEKRAPVFADFLRFSFFMEGLFVGV